MRQILITILFISVSIGAQGQGNNITSLMKSNMSKADQFYNYLDYRTAQFYYYKVLEKEPENEKARLRIAECYLKLDDPLSAQEWLSELAGPPGADAEIKHMYAEVLRMNEHYSLAKTSYEDILGHQVYNESAARKLAFLNNLPYYTRNANLYQLKLLGINSAQSDFSPQLRGSDLVFVSSRRQEIMIQYQPATAHNDLEVMLKYFLAPANSLDNAESVLPLDYGEELKSKFHDGPLWFYNDGRDVAFTRNSPKNLTAKNGSRLVNLEIFFADCSGDGSWVNVQSFPYNSDEFSVGHPSLNSEGSSMYFASNMPGGFGGSDIYVSHLQGGKWGNPQNLGPEVNTSGEEFYPYFQNDSTLFFASSGHGGFGGLDLFVTYARNGEFVNPVNLGAPLNSAQDDFSILIDESGKKGFIASNRPGGTGLDDLYSFRSNYFFATGVVTELRDSGKVLPNAQILLYEEGREDPFLFESDAVGQFRMDLLYDKNYKIAVSKEGYTHLKEVVYSTHGKPMGYDSVFLPLWKQELFVKGLIFSNETQAVIKGATVTIENLEIGTKDSLVTGEDGAYSLMVLPNMKYRIEAKNPEFLTNGYTLNTANIYNGDLLNDIILEEEFLDKAIIYFEFDESKFSAEPHPELGEILKTLKRFPESTLSITAHADARGTAEYNQVLSDRRVVAVLNHFAAKGIKKSRIEGKGFGEELHINECSDGVECHEEDHSQNRRAEIKVQIHSIQ